MTTRTAIQPDQKAVLDGPDFLARIVLSRHNQRIQVLDYEGDNRTGLVAALDRKGRELGFGKVFMKADTLHRPELEDAGMEAEASITGYFAGEDAVVLALFLDPDRRRRPHLDEQEQILEAVNSRRPSSGAGRLPEGYTTRVASDDDFEDLARLYRSVFASYPYPITEPAYLRETATAHVVYRIIRDGDGALVAAASAETDREHRNAEMTDFATLPSQRGLGLARHLLTALESDMRRESIPNLYTIARARSAGMNRVFANLGYEWTGTLVNNCHISGDFEDMHVWCRRA